VYGFNDFDIL